MQASLSLGTQIPTGLSFPLGVCSARHPWGGPSWSSGRDQWSLGLSWLQPFHLQAIITSLLLLLPRLWFQASSNPESFSPHKSNHLRARTPLTRLGSPNSRRRDKALSANHLFWRWFQEALNAEWAMEQKLMGGASVTAPGGWTPPTGEPLLTMYHASELVRPRGVRAGVFLHHLCPSPVESWSRGP